MRHLFLIGLLLMSVALYAAEVVPGTPAQTPWAWLVPLVIAVGMAVLKHVQGGKLAKYLEAALELNRIVYAATEVASATGVKDLVRDAVREVGAGKVAELNDILHPLVDAKAGAKAPPIKRFFRRFLAGKNFAGVVVRSAIGNALAESLEQD